MAIEIERKFLVANDGWRAEAGRGVRYRQGYLAHALFASVRVRLGGGHASITVKSPRRGLTRDEYTYAIPVREAEAMLQRLCGGRVLEKVRYLVRHRGTVWQVDEYRGAAQGLVVAEVELEREDQAFAVPPWAGPEISHDGRYGNSSIALWSEPDGSRKVSYAEDALHWAAKLSRPARRRATARLGASPALP